MARDPQTAPTGPLRIGFDLDESSVYLVDAICSHMGLTRSAFMRAAIQQAVHRYLIGIEDPIRPVPMYSHRSMVRVVSDPTRFADHLKQYNSLEGYPWLVALAQAVTRVQPVIDTAKKRARLGGAPPFDPGNQDSWRIHGRIRPMKHEAEQGVTAEQVTRPKPPKVERDNTVRRRSSKWKDTPK